MGGVYNRDFLLDLTYFSRSLMTFLDFHNQIITVHPVAYLLTLLLI